MSISDQLLTVPAPPEPPIPETTASFQHTFVVEGDLAHSAVSAINLVFGYTRFNYESASVTADVINQNALDDGSIELYQSLSSNAYSIKLPSDALYAADGKSAIPFLQHFNLQFGVRSGGTLSALTRTFTVGKKSDEDLPLGASPSLLEAVYFVRGIYDPGFDGPNNLLGNVIQGRNNAQLTEFIVRNTFLVNKAALLALTDQLATEVPAGIEGMYDRNDRAVFLLQVIDYLTDLTGDSPQLVKTSSAQDITSMNSFLSRMSSPDVQKDLATVMAAFDKLFDFPISTKGIKLQKVGGTFTVKTAGTMAITTADLSLYDLSMEYDTLDEDGQTISHDIHLDWKENNNPIANNSIAFSFSDSQLILPAAPHEVMTVFVRSADSIILWSKEYKGGSSALENIQIVVPMIGVGSLNPSDDTKSNTKRLRGQIIDMTQKLVLKDAMILIQAKMSGDTDWRGVGSANADPSGNFSMAFPYGVYTSAQALVSLMPETPVTIPVNPDTGKNCTISEDFLYLLLRNTIIQEDTTDTTESDCDCNNTLKAARLPDHADLIASDEFTQDLGAGCIKLSTPNRTLSEYSYQAVVRTSDPDVANYTLSKDQNGGYSLTGESKKIKRKGVDLMNPIRWQDAPANHENLSFYQAVTVSTGHILHYKSQFKADGYSLGELLYSLPLAPGQKKQIVVFDAQHSLQGSESQQLSLGESLANSLVNDRSISDQLGGTITEGVKGSSSATTAGVSVAAGAAGSMGSVGGSLGVAGGWSNSNSDASQDSARNISQFFNEKLKNAISQNADSYRQQNASVVTTVTEGQKYAATTEVVANHNHCHSLTMMYFEVLKHYAIYQELTNVEECVFVPLLMTNFTQQNIYKWRDVLAQNLMPLPSNTYLPSIDGQHPLARAFDANERYLANWTNCDFPVNSYGEDPIRYIKGTLSMSVNLARPKTRYDRILTFPIVEHTEGGPSFWDVVKNAVLAPFTAGLPVFGTDEKTTQVRSKIFDSFMTLDANYATVPPAQCIRVTNFQPVGIDKAILAMFAAGTASQTTVSGSDFFDGEDSDRQTWEAIYKIMGQEFPDIYSFLSHYFKNRLISEWDQIYYNDIVPELFDKITKSLVLQQTTASGATIDGSITGLNVSFTSVTRYRGGDATMYLNVYATSSAQRHQLGEKLKLMSYNPNVRALQSLVTLRLENLTLIYSTAHFNGILYSGYIGQDIFSGAYIDIPETDADKRNPRKDDVFLVTRLIDHLNSNLEYYNKVLWYTLDQDRRYMLLDGFNIQVFNDFGVPIGLKSLASVIKNELTTIAGNSLVFPVSSGFKVSKSYIVEKTATDTTETVNLLTHYKPLTPIPPYRMSVPSRGVFAEAVNGSCDSCEKVEPNTSQDWNVFKADEPTAINALTAPTPTVTDWKATFKDMAASAISQQSAPSEPAPGAGMAGLSDALTKSDTFKDITGLSKNQDNAMATYKANTDAVVAMADMAKGLATQEHNTDKSSQIMDKLKEAKNSGAISKEDYSKLVKKHLEKQIDGNDDSDKDEADAKDKDNKNEKDKKVTDAVTKAAGEGRSVEMAEKDDKGNTKAVKIGGKDTSADSTDDDPMTTLASTNGRVDVIQHDLSKSNDSWAVIATMMLNWKGKKSMSITDAMKSLGDKYLKFYTDDKGLPMTEVEDFLKTANLTTEDKAEYELKDYMKWIGSYGPTWIAVGRDATDGMYSGEIWLLTDIIGKSKGDLSDATFIMNSPHLSSQDVLSYTDLKKMIDTFIAKFESGNGYLQIIHFTELDVIDLTVK